MWGYLPELLKLIAVWKGAGLISEGVEAGGNMAMRGLGFDDPQVQMAKMQQRQVEENRAAATAYRHEIEGREAKAAAVAGVRQGTAQKLALTGDLASKNEAITGGLASGLHDAAMTYAMANKPINWLELLMQ